jgi:hypothetical protein
VNDLLLDHVCISTGYLSSFIHVGFACDSRLSVENKPKQTTFIAMWGLLYLVLVVSAHAASESECSQLSDLPFGRLNILHTTDIHGYIYGHKHDAFLDATLGLYFA